MCIINNNVYILYIIHLNINIVIDYNVDLYLNVQALVIVNIANKLSTKLMLLVRHW